MVHVNLNNKINAKITAFPYGSKSELTLLTWCKKCKPAHENLNDFYNKIVHCII